MRYLYPNHRTTTPSNVMVAFIVRRPECHKQHRGSKRYALLQWVSQSYRQETRLQSRKSEAQGETIESFWKEVSARLDCKRPLWLFSHGAGSDMTIMEIWQRLIEEEYSLDEPAARFAARRAKNGKAERQRGFIVTADPPTIVKLWHHSGAKLIWVDIRNYLDKPIEELEAKYAEVGCEFPVRTVCDKPNGDNASRGLAVGAAAVLSLTQFVRSNNLGNFKYTAASQSLAAYRHRFMQGGIMFHDYEPVKKLERASYHGGECECYYVGPVNGSHTAGINDVPVSDIQWGTVGEPSIYHLDVNGLYPYVMMRERLPAKLIDYGTGEAALRLVQSSGPMNCIATVSLKTERTDYPVIQNGQTMYCVGEFDATLCGPELSRAWTFGDVVSVREAAAYECKVLFSKFVHELWGLRMRYKRSGNKVFADLCKLICCSLYGKFSQRNPQWRDIPDGWSELPWGYFFDLDSDTGNYESYRSIAHNVQVETDRGEREDTSVAISSFVTAHGREYMRWLRRMHGNRNCYYQGVDSLICDKSLYLALLNGGLVHDELIGMLKVKGVHSTAFIHGVNDYELDGDRKKAGVSRPWDAKESGGWVQQYEGKLDATIGHKSGPLVYSYERLLGDRQAYTRGIVTGSGWVKPWNLS